MNSTKYANCTRCGTPIPEGAADRLCPACLMSGAIAAHGVNTETELAGSGEPASAPETAPPHPTKFPCEFGGYRLLSLLGSGGMGSVYEAEQLATGRRVALKMLGQKLDSPDMRKRFLREGRLAASVSHPNSLFVFGTEEVEGRPIILMEIASGGTLHDKLKKRGPLPVVEAVDTILDLIAGLEAAFNGGVLHRDVKPSNCFVSPDGSVKVGDFGLSVSTVATADTFQTATGVIMGTPAYAPPEQLRGRDVDVRSDIYSVGATLFTLLTNKPPIEGSNPVEVVAAALDAIPKSLSKLREDIPPGLANVVARCLAKKPEQRYSDYAALRNALLSFSSAQAVPAPLGRRFLAGIIDTAFVGIISWALLLAFFGIDLDLVMQERSPALLGAYVGLLILNLVYFTICEGIWGASLGKALLGFQVVRTDGRGPGLTRAFFRATIGTLFSNLGSVVGLTVFTAANYDDIGFVALTETLDLMWVLAFVTMRGRNGFATVWDLATGTRVVVKPQGAEQPVIEVKAAPEVSVDKVVLVGPYQVVEEIVPGQWIAAHDPTLRRGVWLRRQAGSEIATSPRSLARRDLARPGRNRWLQQVETAEATWDVFESQPGVSLRRLIDQKGQLPWQSVRYWLHDLACEIALAAHDETLPPELSLDHVWITASGRAILLDEPWPKADKPADHIPVSDLAGQQRFLHAIDSSVSPTSVPLHARPVLQSLSAGSFEKLTFLAGSLRSLLTKPATVDRQFRAASLLALPLFVLTIILPAILISGARETVPEAVSEYDSIIREMEAEMHDIDGFDWEMLNSEDIDWETIETEVFWELALYGPIATAAVLAVLFAVTQLIGLLAGRGTLSQFVFGFAVVDAAGAPASRTRLFARWLVAWFPVLLIIVVLIVGQDADTALLDYQFEPLFTWFVGLMLIIWFAGLAAAIVRPTRGLHDQLTGCWLVRR